MRRFLIPLCLFAVVALTFAVYYPGLSGSFLFDDNPNIVNNEAVRIHSLSFGELKAAALSGSAGILGRSLSFISFGIDHYFSGLSAPAFKLTNLVIHVLNGIAVFFFTKLLLAAFASEQGVPATPRASWIAVSIAGAWLLHPLNLTSVLYVVQRMTSLAALFTLFGMISYLYGRLQLLEGKERAGWTAVVASVMLWTPLALLSKENGALLPPLLLLIELYFFRLRVPSPGGRRLLAGMFGLAVILPAAALLAYTVARPDWIMNAYETRTFTLYERLLTETRVIWMYVTMAFVPDLTKLGLYHDDIAVSRSLFDPALTMLASAGIVALIGAAIASFRHYRLLSFGIAFFLLGHAMESTVLGLELAHEHRNYLPLLGLLLPLFYHLITQSQQMKMAFVRPMIVTGILLMLGAVTLIRAGHWGDPVTMLEKEALHHPQSPRSNSSLANFYAATPPANNVEAHLFYENAFEYYAKASEASASDTTGLFGLLRLTAEHGQPPDDTWVRVLNQRIAAYPVSSDTVNGIVYTQKCISDKRCKFQSDFIGTVITTALDNRRLARKQRSLLLLAYSDYLQGNGDDDAAIAAAASAVGLDPSNLDTRRTQVIFLINMGHYTDAQSALDKMREQDRLQVQTKTISYLQDIIRQQKRAPQPSTPS